MFFKNEKFIDIRLISCKSILTQLLKLIAYIQYALEQNSKEDIVLTVIIRNKHNIKLLHAVDSKNLSSIAYNSNIIIGD